MTSKFKRGPAKTRDGRDAFIFEVSEMIYGKVKENHHDSVWKVDHWELNGLWDVGIEGEADILPNVEPFRFEAQVEWRLSGITTYPIALGGQQVMLMDLAGKRGKLVFMEDE